MTLDRYDLYLLKRLSKGVISRKIKRGDSTKKMRLDQLITLKLVQESGWWYKITDAGRKALGDVS